MLTKQAPILIDSLIPQVLGLITKPTSEEEEGSRARIWSGQWLTLKGHQVLVDRCIQLAWHSQKEMRRSIGQSQEVQALVLGSLRLSEGDAFPNLMQHSRSLGTTVRTDTIALIKVLQVKLRRPKPKALRSPQQLPVSHRHRAHSSEVGQLVETSDVLVGSPIAGKEAEVRISGEVIDSSPQPLNGHEPQIDLPNRPSPDYQLIADDRIMLEEALQQQAHRPLDTPGMLRPESSRRIARGRARERIRLSHLGCECSSRMA
jgi:hypothetical protein